LFTKTVYVFTLFVHMYTKMFTSRLQISLHVYKSVYMLVLSDVYRFVIVVYGCVYNDYIMFTILHFHFFYSVLLMNLSNSYTLILEKLDTYLH